MISPIKIFNFLACIFALLVAILAGSYLYSAVFEEPYLSYKEMPFAVQGLTYAGGPAVSHVIRCNSSGSTKSYTTTRGFQKMGSNQLPTILPSIDLTVEPGCEPAISRINIVPDNALPGWYRFVGVASVHGLLVWHEVPWSTNFFEVVAKPAKETEIVLTPSTNEIKIEVTP